MKSSLFKKFISVSILPLVCCFLVSCNKEPESEYLINNMPQDQASQPVPPKQESDYADEFEKRVIVSVENYGRVDPFVPYSERNIVVSDVPKFSDIPPPPSLDEVDTSVQELVKAKVTGILYDRYKPSAIINVLGEDHLVRKGDTISEFYVQDIQKDYVTIASGFNTYNAEIGEVVEGEVKYSNINDIENRFAGAKKFLKSNNDDNIYIRPIKSTGKKPSKGGLPALPKT